MKQKSKTTTQKSYKYHIMKREEEKMLSQQKLFMITVNDEIWAIVDLNDSYFIEP